MKLILKARNVKLTSQHKSHIERRVAFAFSRLSEMTQSITIMLSDVNGPKGGTDKQCKVVVRLFEKQDVVVTDRQSKLNHAIDRALYRASYAMQRQLKRKKQLPLRRTMYRRTAPYFDDDSNLQGLPSF